MDLWQYLKAESSLLAEERDGGLLQRVELLAQHEQRPPDEVIRALLSQALEARHSSDSAHQHWRSLSPREKNVAALICSGLTGRQAAARLVISPETVKTHARNILRKFNLRSRRELRALLEGWDLSAWMDAGC